MAPISRKKRPLIREKGINRDASLIIIAVEGAKTEHLYFSDFRSSRVRCKVISPEENKSSPKHVLKCLSDFANEFQIDADSDQLWLLCDRDNWTPGELSRVAQECQKKGFGLAVSNPCFECWLVLHFREIKDAISNSELISFLKKDLCFVRDFARKKRRLWRNVHSTGFRSSCQLLVSEKFSGAMEPRFSTR